MPYKSIGFLALWLVLVGCAEDVGPRVLNQGDSAVKRRQAFFWDLPSLEWGDLGKRYGDDRVEDAEPCIKKENQKLKIRTGGRKHTIRRTFNLTQKEMDKELRSLLTGSWADRFLELEPRNEFLDKPANKKAFEDFQEEVGRDGEDGDTSESRKRSSYVLFRADTLQAFSLSESPQPNCKVYVKGVVPGAVLIAGVRLQFIKTSDRNEFHSKFVRNRGSRGVEEQAPFLQLSNPVSLDDEMQRFLKAEGVSVTMHVILFGGGSRAAIEIVKKTQCSRDNLAGCRDTLVKLEENYGEQLKKVPNETDFRPGNFEPFQIIDYELGMVP